MRKTAEPHSTHPPVVRGSRRQFQPCIARLGTWGLSSLPMRQKSSCGSPVANRSLHDPAGARLRQSAEDSIVSSGRSIAAASLEDVRLEPIFMLRRPLSEVAEESPALNIST